VPELHMCQINPIELGDDLMAFHWLILCCISLRFAFLFSSLFENPYPLVNNSGIGR